MCIALFSTTHPTYPFILLNNRDEFFTRPTIPANWWDPPHNHILGGRDTQRQERGTWLGITKQGRIAVLTNFREEGAEVTKDKSRGGIINAYLSTPPDQHENPQQFAHRLMTDVGTNDVGGFSLLFGELKAPQDGILPGLSVLSNRSASSSDMKHIATSARETHGLSNSHFGDTSWPKVVHGERLLRQAITADIDRENDSEATFIDRLFDILSIDVLPHRGPDEDWDVYVRQMRNSIFIPSVGRSAPPAVRATGHLEAAAVNGTSTPREGNVPDSGTGYGTQKQTVVLVDREGHVKFVERTLYDGKGRRLEAGEGDRVYEFDIEGWQR